MIGWLPISSLFLTVFSECGKKLVGDASGVGHSTGIESGPTEVGLFILVIKTILRMILSKMCS